MQRVHEDEDDQLLDGSDPYNQEATHTLGDEL